MSRLELRAVRSGYGGSTVLHDVEISVGDHEIVAVLGPNGAGKTTLLNTISGLVSVMSGTVFLDGVSLGRLQPHRVVKAGVVQVPEGRRIFAELTVEENLLVGGYVSSTALLEERRRRVYDLFPVLKERRRQPGGTLSGGEQQMLAIGRALCAGPRLLMLDEPSMGLAPKVVSDVYASLPSIVAAGTSVLLVEQNARKALQFAGRGYVLDHGSVALSGSSEELRDSPALRELYLGGEPGDGAGQAARQDSPGIE